MYISPRGATLPDLLHIYESALNSFLIYFQYIIHLPDELMICCREFNQHVVPGKQETKLGLELCGIMLVCSYTCFHISRQ